MVLLALRTNQYADSRHMTQQNFRGDFLGDSKRKVQTPLHSRRDD